MRELARSAATREMDLAAECHSAERIAGRRRYSRMLIPKVHWAHTHERINVQEYIAGIPGSDLERVSAEGWTGPLLARRGGRRC